MTFPLTRKVRERLKIAQAATRFTTAKIAAIGCAKKGNRDSARWWGAQARSDWRALYHLLTC